MGFFDFIGDAAQWAVDRIDDAAQWVEQRADDVGGWFSDLYHGNLGDQAVPTPALVQKIIASQGAQSWHQSSDIAKALARMHDEANDLVRKISYGLESSWAGGGADAAQARIRPFAEALTSSAQITYGNSDNVSEIAHSFDGMKSSLQPMPPVPPHKNLFDQASPWDTDTERQINEYNAIAKDNVAKYQTYARHIETKAPELSTNYIELSGLGDQKIDINSPEDKRQNVAEGKHSPRPGGNAEWSPPPSTHGPAAPSSGQATVAPPSSTAPPVHHSTPQQGDGTTSAGWTPSPAMPVGGTARVGGGSGNNAAPWLPGFGGGMGDGGARPGNEAGEGWYAGSGGDPRTNGGNSGNDRSRGTGGNNGSSRNGERYGGNAGNTSRPGGPRTGVGEGEEAVGRGANGTAGRGSTGARGTSVGGVGPGGKGKSEEDKEHQRKYGVDDDSAFTLVDDEGERVLDPRTGLPPTPPTIGG